MLERLGYAYETATSGSEVISALQEGNFDPVLMDCQMPDMDGYEATCQIRTSGKEYARVPIIAVTASVLAEDRTLSVQAGMTDFLPKPTVLDDLASTLRAYLTD